MADTIQISRRLEARKSKICLESSLKMATLTVAKII